MAWEKGKKALLQELMQMIASRAEPDHALGVDALARAFFRGFPAEDLRDAHVDDIYGLIYGCYHSLMRWDGAAAKVRIFNPDLEKHGWESNHTVVVIIAPDTPFLLDSSRGELNRRNITIHKLHGQYFQVLRDTDGKISGVSASETESARGADNREQAVSVVYFEINHCSDAAEIAEISATLSDIMGEVACVVGDFAPMRAKLAEVTVMVQACEQVEREVRDEHPGIHSPIA